MSLLRMLRRHLEASEKKIWKTFFPEFSSDEPQLPRRPKQFEEDAEGEANEDGSDESADQVKIS
jgi:hypothetical protein